MNSGSRAEGFLDTIGRAILTADTRWLILGAVGFVGVFFFILWRKKNRLMSRDDATSLGLALLQLYSAPVLFSMLVLTQPPATDLVSGVQRQGAGLLAFIFLVAGVFVQIKKIWSGSPSDNQHQPRHIPKAGTVAVTGNVAAGNANTGAGGDALIEGGTGMDGASGGDVRIGPGNYSAGAGGASSKGGDLTIKGGDAKK